MSVATPDTEQQRLDALQSANYIRSSRAKFKKLIKETHKSGRQRDARTAVCKLIAAPPDWSHTWRLHSLLEAIPAMGVAKLTRLLISLGLDAGATLGSLPPTSRLALIEYLHPDLENAKWIG